MSTYPFTPLSTWGTTRGGGGGGSLATTAEAATAPITGAVSGAESGMQVGWSSVWWDNPFFWLVGLILIITGYIMFGFNAGVKHVGKAKVEVN